MRNVTETDRLSYALAKQIPTLHTLGSSYGDIDLNDDAELLEAVRAAVEPILRRRIQAARTTPNTSTEASA